MKRAFPLLLVALAALVFSALPGSSAQISSPYARYFAQQTSDPATGREGQVYANTTSHTPKYFKGSSWLTLQTTSSAPGGSSGDVQCNSSGSFGACATTGTGSVVRSTGAPTFTAVTYTNSWVDFGGTIQTVGYYKDPFGFVHLRGAMKSGTAGAAAFTLPSGFRPAAQEAFLVVNGGDAASSSGVTITSAGVVTPSASLGNVFVYLSGITFLGQ